MAGTRSISVHPGSITLSVNSSYENLRAVVDADSASCKTVTWESDKPDIATVNPTTGYVFAKSVGDAVVYAKTLDGKSDYCSVTVVSTPVKVTYVSLNQDSVYMQKGGTYEFTPTVSPDYATNRALSWTSSNQSVATVSNGVVTAKAVGHTQIQATSTDGSKKYDCCDVYVTAATLVTSVEVSPSSKTMTVGDSARLYATVNPSNATNKQVEWKSDNSNIVTVNPEDGIIYAISPGTTKIRATAQDGSNKYGECTVTVNPKISVEGVDVFPKNVTLNVGEWTNLNAGVYPVNATNTRVTWYTSNEDVVCVDYYTGAIQGNGPGTATITAVTDDGQKKDICTVTVKELVIIQKDGNYSKVILDDGKVWKCNSFRYDTNTKSYSPRDFQRANHNDSIDFSEKQLGFLFRIDPNGVNYYVNNKDLGTDASPTDYLIYRDNIFKEIYGRLPYYFTYENSQISYRSGIDHTNRYDVYSEAELIFGMLPRWSWDIVDDILQEIVFDMITNLLGVPPQVILTYDILKAFFFTDAFDGAENAATELFIKSIEGLSEEVDWLKIFEWPLTIVGLLGSLSENVLPPDIDEAQISIYESAYKNELYEIKIADSNQSVDLNEFIEHYKDLLSE